MGTADRYLEVHVTPGSKRTEIDIDSAAGTIRVHVSAPAERGAANEAVRKLLADRLDMPRTAMRLASGATSRRKLIEADGLDAPAAMGRLLNRDRSSGRTGRGSER